MQANINREPFYHSGYPTAWDGLKRNRVYGLYCPQKDCFLYVNYQVELVKKVQFFLTSKILTWVVDLWLPDELSIVEDTISNLNCEYWTMQGTTKDIDMISYANTHHELFYVDCTNLNIRNQLSGIDRKTDNPDQDCLDLKRWTLFMANTVDLLSKFEYPSEYLMARLLVANGQHITTDLLDGDVYHSLSQIYNILLINDDVETARLAIQEVLKKQDSPTRLLRYYQETGQWINLQSI